MLTFIEGRRGLVQGRRGEGEERGGEIFSIPLMKAWLLLTYFSALVAHIPNLNYVGYIYVEHGYKIHDVNSQH